MLAGKFGQCLTAKRLCPMLVQHREAHHDQILMYSAQLLVSRSHSTEQRAGGKDIPSRSSAQREFARIDGGQYDHNHAPIPSGEYPFLRD